MDGGYKNLYVNVLNGTLKGILKISNDAIQSRNRILGAGINLNRIYLIQHNTDFANAIEQAIFCPLDGTSIIWILNWMGTPHEQKVVEPNATLALCKLTVKKHYKIFVLGGKEGAAKKRLKYLGNV